MRARVCHHCGKRKLVESFDLSGRVFKQNGSMSSICKTCSIKVKYRKERGRGYVTFANNSWTMPTPFFKPKNRWGEAL